MKYQRLKGTDDIFGADSNAFFDIETKARIIFAGYNFKEIKTPIIESKGLFTHALGETTDVVQKEMYEFLDKSDEYVVLRPEGTAGVVRAYLENNFDKNEKESKFFYVGPMFRRERPQKGRYRQFHQMGVEYFGTVSPYADAEVIDCLIHILRMLEIKDFKLKINTLGSFEDRQKYKASLEKYFQSKLDHLCEDCRNRLSKNVMRILDCKKEKCRQETQKAPVIHEFLSPAGKQHYEQVKEALTILNIPFAEEPYMVRGLDYYSDTVFEVTHPALGSQDAIGAGGRYDRLVDLMGGKSRGAVGFALGVERLKLVREMAGTTQSMAKSLFQPDILIVSIGDAGYKKAFELLARLRIMLISVEMEMDKTRKISNVLSAVSKNQAYRIVVIIGDDEVKKNTIKIKDMGEQKEKEFEWQAGVNKLVEISGRLLKKQALGKDSAANLLD